MLCCAQRAFVSLMAEFWYTAVLALVVQLPSASRTSCTPVDWPSMTPTTTSNTVDHSSRRTSTSCGSWPSSRPACRPPEIVPAIKSSTFVVRPTNSLRPWSATVQAVWTRRRFVRSLPTEAPRIRRRAPDCRRRWKRRVPPPERSGKSSPICCCPAAPPRPRRRCPRWDSSRRRLRAWNRPFCSILLRWPCWCPATEPSRRQPCPTVRWCLQASQRDGRQAPGPIFTAIFILCFIPLGNNAWHKWHRFLKPIFTQSFKMGTVTKGFDRCSRLANRQFLVLDFRALWRSTVSARVPERVTAAADRPARRKGSAHAKYSLSHHMVIKPFFYSA